MLTHIIKFSIKNKFIILIGTVFIIGFGFFALSKISVGAVPDVTNNQVQIITTSKSLSTQDIELFITYPIELEMGNLPGVKEIRSISKFGLSVVTIVFEDGMGTYLPRQLITEKIKSASEQIPEGFGSPQMGPITTGLGEIYQYILDVEPQFKNRYSAEDLRTIQDWIVKRQLTGIPGVVEVNTWGGYLKQYEVAVNTEQLNAMQISAHEVFEALELNNHTTGGAYIEKVNQAYFIRGEGLITSLEDINNIVVSNKDGIPVYIRDVAKVGFGNAVRFGAITGNGEGEKVLGQVMMLKDANSKEVIEAVKERVNLVSKSLPEGVYINAFLDRSELIDKTTFTVVENLLLGCLIVVLVVFLLLGNLRSGLVIASVIPLCLLFALSLMYMFGVDANLMSLGAIDFGIIIDGAVIIVEFIAFQITAKTEELSVLSTEKQRNKKDEITISSTSKMMNSAIFGQLIILLVFIPILTLDGVEGKMFRPMALTFSFALIGAMILCFTYVPVVSSIFLNPSKNSKNNLSSKFLTWLNKLYDPAIRWALNNNKLVIGLAVIILCGAGFIFSKMGSEFVPTLDEGDFVIQPVLKTGTSLSNTIEITTEIESILLNTFPEVEQVVTRIGAAEVPTDPMSMEESDVIIILKPRSEWTSAKTKDELADKFKEALTIIPGMEVEFTQPIEMRFNELITGVRADIAIKVFGENLEILSSKANEIAELINEVEGASDITVEKIVGLPEMRVQYDRSKLARYGINIKDANDIIAMGFAGKTVGSVFEGEKRFDLVVRLDNDKRQDIDNLKMLYIDLPSGGKIPLNEIAKISYEKGAAKISRDNTRRRIVVGINVRNRDLQSVVDDIQALVDSNISMPPGYSITYGGQFENLQSAKARLLIAVPIALLLIFLLLTLAFKSVKQALMVFSAIPLAAVGGVLLLWLRDMPFSISAGVGFIALFGIAVLNGIVLIEHFKELDINEFKSINDLIKKGTKDRLRAVLLTASAAAFGFLPMAISTNVGAEVQRPLATVVIGGLISATLLTLIVLPVLYSLFTSSFKYKKINMKTSTSSKLLIFLLLCSMVSYGQEYKALSLDSLISLGLENNLGIKANILGLNQSEELQSSASLLEKTEIYYQFDENNLAINNKPIGVFGIQQDFRFPTLFLSENRLNKAKYQMTISAYNIKVRQFEEDLVKSYYNYQIAHRRKEVLRKLDSVYNDFARIAKRRFELGETNYLEKITATSKQRQIRLNYEAAQTELTSYYVNLKALVQSSDSLAIAQEPNVKVSLQTIDLGEGSLGTIYYQDRAKVAENEMRFEKQKLLPDLSMEYFQGSNSQLNYNLIGYQFGLKIPLLFGGQSSKIKAAKLGSDIAVLESYNFQIELNKKFKNLQNKLQQLQKSLNYYENEGDNLSKEILKTANSSFQNGEIDFYQYIQSLESTYSIQLEYLEKLQEYNNIVIEINYLTL